MYALIDSLLALDFLARIATAEASICLIPLSVVSGAPRTVSVFVPLTVALLSLEAFLVQMEAAVAWVLVVSLVIWPWVVDVWMVFEANEISMELYMALSAAFLALEAFLGLMEATKAWEFADSLASGAWVVCGMTDR